ncbi:YybS family protein [Paenibacillus sp. ATY16]|nr:YybS family protein [Paenibacillus sp. ATY16]
MSLAVPVFNMLTIMLLMVPYVILYTTLSTRSFLLHLVPVWIIAAVILGPSVLIIALFFLIPAMVMGQMYRKKASAPFILRRTTLTILFCLLAELLIFEGVLKQSFIDQIGEFVRSLVADLDSEHVLPKEWNSDYTESIIKIMIQSIPQAIILISFVYAVITQYFARKALASSIEDIPTMPKAKDWMLPRIMVFYYLVVYILQMFADSTSSSFYSVALMNVVPLMRYAFTIQAIGFFFYIAHQRRWNKAVPVIIAIPLLIFPPLSLIGVLDAAFPIRKSFSKSS